MGAGTAIEITRVREPWLNRAERVADGVVSDGSEITVRRYRQAV